MSSPFKPLIPQRPAKATKGPSLPGAKRAGGALPTKSLSQEELRLRERALGRPDLSNKSNTPREIFSDLIPRSLPRPPTKNILVTELDEIDRIVEECRKAKLCAFDFETSGLDPHSCHVVSLQITCKVGMGYYIPIAHEGYEHNVDRIEVIKRLHTLLVDPNVVIIAHNIKFDYKWVVKDGYLGLNNVWDTMVAAHVINENRPAYNLKYLTRYILEFDMITFKSLGIWTKEGPCPEGLYPHFGHLPLKEALPYACADVDMALRLYFQFRPIIDQQFKTIFYQVEMPLRAVLARMELAGVELDIEYMAEVGRYLAKEIATLKQYLIDTVNEMNPLAFQAVLEQLNESNYYKRPNKDGTLKKKKGFVEEFSWASTTHLRLLFTLLGIDTGRCTPGSRKKKKSEKIMSTDKKALLGMARRPAHAGHRIAKALMGYRQLDKIHGSFCVKLPGKINKITGRIHPDFRQTTTVTARLSCRDPNMQQIPKSGICAVRYPFKPKKGYVFLQCDYSQVELRILAHMANDKLMIQAFEQGVDIHSLTAYECFKISQAEFEAGKEGIPEGTPIGDIKELYPKLRSAAKTIAFGIVYGMGAKALSEALDITLEDAQRYIQAFLDAKPNVQVYMTMRERDMDDLGYVETLLGRRRHISAGADGRRPFGWQRQAINFPIQSASAEVLKVVMARLMAKLDESEYDAQILLQIHDELIIECKEEHAAHVLPIIKTTFEEAAEPLGVKYSVPLNADPEIQYRWNINAEMCPDCGHYTLCEDGRTSPDPERPNRTIKLRSCMRCNDVRYPGQWDLAATVKTIEEKAITNPDD